MRRTFAIITVPLLLVFAFYLLAMTRTEEEDVTAAGRNRQVRSDPVVQEPGKPRETLEQKFVRILAEERAAAMAQVPAAQPSANPPIESPGTPGNSIEKTTPRQTLPRETPSDSTQKDPVWGMYVGIAQSPDDLIDLEATQLIGRLVITGDQFSNQSLNHLDGRRILSLSIEAVNIGNSGLLHVSKVKNLCELRLWAPGVNDHGLKLLAEMHHLEVLDLEGTSVQGTGLTHLSGLNKLRKLTLGPRTRDEDVVVLKTLPCLAELDLRSCHRLTDACVASLAGLQHLQTIWLPAQISALGATTIRETLPDCDVRS